MRGCDGNTIATSRSVVCRSASRRWQSGRHDCADEFTVSWTRSAPSIYEARIYIQPYRIGLEFGFSIDYKT